MLVVSLAPAADAAKSAADLGVGTLVNGTGVWHAEQAWLGHQAYDVVIEVEDGRIKAVREEAPAPPGAVQLRGWTVPGFANVHSHAFQHGLRGITESGGGDFWEWRTQMYRAAENVEPGRYLERARKVFREMLKAGITAVGEFHYLHALGNQLGDELIEAAERAGIRITLLDTCYLRGGMDGKPLEGAQRTFSDGDADRWARRMDEFEDGQGVRIGAAIHSVRAVDPASMRTVAGWARKRNAPLHIHLAEQPAEVEECLAAEGCTPAQLLDREGILGADLTAIHAIHLDDRDISLLGANRVSICACTTTERDLGDRVGPIRRLADAGCTICVGSDSNAMIDILEEARGLEVDQRRSTGRRVIHQPEELFRAATIDGMQALGWDAGELKPGMLADFVTINQNWRSEWRVLNLDYLMFGCSARDVTNVVVGGTTVFSK
ncbi:MAG: formimidoylglutamate deiminase [Actinobacteria bacterium 13_1_20CM_2_65_11]|nr:MAG: formimidoylglutamate deiminase [Chloroflexi bacterium 13_1_40CM_65_17]OLC64993.1 MAG: formimidoylglutamate deiminase [Actinobacteria bacterium 13_1_40CM_4_65_12]OLD25963.1 MAG: formimidoylglutamate deiminase [Chloroflexi bacterium 13_1_40CM_3_65_12]OLD49012.1 MAG: formimidoylglutamate deiminase [Actinobacteria bacterium 13_1_40CM_2_65_8]OLE80538.1 MAG: formimidoylglutamate deiminase [Actinobacteria bacterium 13_1_20CM_2_65_11]